MDHRKTLAAVVCAIGIAAATPAHAVFIGNTQGGTDFPGGNISFADSLVSLTYTSSVPGEAYQDGGNALGLPDYTGSNTCATQEICTFVSLGSGGSIVLRFDDNFLTGSDSPDLDLWVFEVGPNVEDTFVDISVDGSAWFGVGKVFGSTSGIDIDSYGYSSADMFRYLRLTDDVNEGGGGSGGTVGADIDAVGAISTIARDPTTPPTVSVPEPASLALFGVSLLGLAGLRRRRRTA